MTELKDLPFRVWIQKMIEYMCIAGTFFIMGWFACDIWSPGKHQVRVNAPNANFYPQELTSPGPPLMFNMVPFQPMPDPGKRADE